MLLLSSYYVKCGKCAYAQGLVWKNYLKYSLIKQLTCPQVKPTVVLPNIDMALFLT